MSAITMSSELTIRHDYESGTTVEDTKKNSPAHEALKAHPSWTWSRYAGAWLLRSSRHRRAKLGAIEAMQRILTDLGYTVDRDIDDAMPGMQQQETDLAERMDDRQDRLAQRSDNWAAKADATRAKADAVFDNIPLGQPMLPGHYSYAADRNRRERAWNNLGKSIQEADVAADLARQADTAGHHMGARYSPETVGNRIATLEAQRRRVQRCLDGQDTVESSVDESGRLCERPVTRPPVGEYAARLRADAHELDEKISYWRQVYARLQIEGKASSAGPDTVKVGDFVAIHGLWCRVRRVNRKSVTVPNPVVAAPAPGVREWTRTVPWHRITEHRSAAAMSTAYVATYETPGVDRFRLGPPTGSA